MIFGSFYMYSKKYVIGVIVSIVVGLNVINIVSAKSLNSVRAVQSDDNQVIKKQTLPSPSANTYIPGEKSLSKPKAIKSDGRTIEEADETAQPADSVPSDVTIQKIQLPNLVPKNVIKKD